MFTISQQSIKPIPEFSSFLGTLNKVPKNISIKKGPKNNKRRFLEKETNPYKIANFIFKEIAETTGLSAANCRKKKQRALVKVKKMFFNAIRILILILLNLA